MHRSYFSKLTVLRKCNPLINDKRSFANRNLFIYGNEIASAKKNGQPIVALESTIITHGMPYPHNLNTAIKVENVVRKQDAVPATIGILNGKVYVGLNQEQLETLSKADPTNTLKCSRRDLSLIASKGLNGGTTVSATMLLAKLADIPIMATGGIGGVHRGAESTFDISTDLMELGRTPVAVVCSGIKSILDIGKTLEYLETQGIPVIKIGNSDYFPAFYCTETVDKIKAPYRVPNSKEAANVIRSHKDMGLNSGILFAVSIPKMYALDPKEIESVISKAIEKARSSGITGKDVTPFLLQELNQLTSGQSLDANMALIENNAKVAADIAVELCEKHPTTAGGSVSVRFAPKKQNPVVVGGATYDTTLQIEDSEIKSDGRTHVGRSRTSCGGVARNVANALYTLGLQGTRLISLVGNDEPGRAVGESLKDCGEFLERILDIKTARYTAIVDYKGECRFGVGEMGAFGAISPDLIRKHRSLLERASFIVLDGNAPVTTLKLVMDIAVNAGIPVWYEPTDKRKATKIFENGVQRQDALHFISPNANELLALSRYFGIPSPEDKSELELDYARTITEQLAEYIPVVISTLGPEGVVVARRGLESDPFYNEEGKLIEKGLIVSRIYPPHSHISKDSDEICSVSGCGDCLNAGIIYGIHCGLNETDCLSAGLEAAAISLKSYDPVPTTLLKLGDTVY